MIYYCDDIPKIKIILKCTKFYFSNLKYDKVQNKENNLKQSTNIEIDTYEHKLNNWLVSIEDVLSSFNLSEGQKNTLKKLLKK